MKRILLMTLLMLGITISQAQVTPGSTDNFITVWNTLTTTSITIPTSGSGYNYDLYWEEVGNPSNNGNLLAQTGNATISGLATGTDYRIEIAGDFPRVYLNLGAERLKLAEISQWGSIQWSSMQNAFWGCSNMDLTASDVPDLTNVTNCSRMFAGCSALSGVGANWNWSTTNVSDFSLMFFGTTSFNQPIGNWDTQNASNMQQMFNNASVFNQPIGDWNTSNVINMQQMFQGAAAFNQDIGNWNTSSVTNMETMFRDAVSFNQDIGNWNTANVTTMRSMFNSCTSFNQNIGGWNTANVTDMLLMFYNASAFNQNIGNWDTGNVMNMEQMLRGASSFNQDIGNWNTESVTTFLGMFYDAIAFNQNIGNWNLTAATTINNMLFNCGIDCYHYSQTLIGWEANGNTPNDLTLGADGCEYGTNAVTARDILINTKGWSINGDAASGTDCSTSPSNPVIVVNESLSSFSQVLGTPSAEQSFTVEGTDLTDNITVTAPTNYEVSLTSVSGFASSVQVNQTGGTVTATTIYVRLNAAAVGANNGDITLSSGALNETVSVTGNTTQYTANLSENLMTNLSIFPNPGSGMVVLSVSQPTTAVLLGVNGAVLANFELNNKTSIDVSSYAPGVYFIRTTEGQVVKFVKQ